MRDRIETRELSETGPSRILTPEALGLLVELHDAFDERRQHLLTKRNERQSRINAGEFPTFLTETEEIRESDWQVSPVPAVLADRRVEITGPTDRKMVINALNSGARVFMADFEDANSPTWQNIVEGQDNLVDAVNRTIEFTDPTGRQYQLEPESATLFVRPRGWHLEERNVAIDGRPCSASLFDFALFLFHNAQSLIESGNVPAFYLPKLESHLEARLWNEVFNLAQNRLGIAKGTIKATVLVETVTAAFEMEEILFELREHSAGLNAGRWDYIFSVIKRFRTHPEFLLPDRDQVTMTTSFMRAYTELLVRTCHKRNAFAIGGMAAFIPNRRDLKANELALAKVREDKVREAEDGFDGTWVAHPDLVPVAMEVFDDVLGDAPNQIHRRREDVNIGPSQLLDVKVQNGTVTTEGLRTNVRVGILYIESWLRGVGAAALFNLMEDTATAEISRSQVWQWTTHGAKLADGGVVTEETVREVIVEELEWIRNAVGNEAYDAGRYEEASQLFEQVSLSEAFVDFLTEPAYAHLD